MPISWSRPRPPNPAVAARGDRTAEFAVAGGLAGRRWAAGDYPAPSVISTPPAPMPVGPRQTGGRSVTWPRWSGLIRGPVTVDEVVVVLSPRAFDDGHRVLDGQGSSRR